METEPLLFSGLEPGRSPKVSSLLGSLVCHAAGLTLAMVLGHYLAVLHQDDVDWSRFQVEPLRLHVAEPLFFNARSAGLKPAPKSPTAPQVEEPQAPAGAAAASPAPSAAPAVPRRLELPPTRQAKADLPILLQPEIQPKLQPLPANLPPMAFWSSPSPAPPKPPRKAFVVPGRTEAPAPAPQLSAPPVLAVPNRETAVSNINVSLPPALRNTTPPLPLPNSSTTPVRLRDAAESRAASFDVATGQPVNVMSLARERSDAREVTVPRGAQNIPPSEKSDGREGNTAAGNTSPSAQPSTSQSTPTQSSASQTGAGQSAGKGNNPRTETAAVGEPKDAPGPNRPSTTPAAPAPAAPTTPAPASSTTGGGRGGRSPLTDSAGAVGTPANGQPSGSIASASAPAPAPSPRPGSPGGVKEVRHPVNGNFDVVVTQSAAAREDLAGLGAVLTGNPVYSVYLTVGDQKEWLLEYCVPAKANARANPYQVDVDDVGTITPPYPISTVIPNSVLSQPIAKRLVLHGFLTAAGTLRNIGTNDTSHPIMSELLALLSQWQFRPALRNSRPIDVEIVLVIPRRG